MIPIPSLESYSCLMQGRVVDMNQWDILMRRLGVSSPFVRHKVNELTDLMLTCCMVYLLAVGMS